MSKLPDALTPPRLPSALPGFGERICATIMAQNLLELMRKCRAGAYNAEVHDRAARCLNYELASIARHKTNIVWA